MSRKYKLLITGVAGSFARDLLPRFNRTEFEITGFDRDEIAHESLTEFVLGELKDQESLGKAIRGQDGILHLAGVPLEDEWESLLRTNIDGSYQVLQTARLAGVKRVVLASSIHAVGFNELPNEHEFKLSEELPFIPDTLYGVSKASMEALGAYFFAKHGLEVVNLRIASRQSSPTTRRTLASWLSPDDAFRLVLASLTHEFSGLCTIWGVSNNTDSYFDQTAGQSIGYVPVDDAEHRRTEIQRIDSKRDPSANWLHLVGGEFCSQKPPSVGGKLPSHLSVSEGRSEHANE